MRNIDKLLLNARRAAYLESESRKVEDLTSAVRKMSTEQLMELVYADPSESRIRDIYASVGCLDMLKRG